MKTFNQQLPLLVALSSVLTLQAHASDLSIYQGASQDPTVLTLMLDTSGSMNTYDAPCVGTNSDGNQVFTSNDGRVHNKSDNPDYSNYPWDFQYVTCGRNGSGEPYPQRINSLKMAVYDVVGVLSPDVKMAVGTYPNPDFTGAAYSSNQEEWAQGAIKVPANSLNQTHINTIRDFVSGLSANAGTPLSHGYAEAAAYMLGTNTNASGGVTVVVPRWRVDDRSGGSSERLYECRNFDRRNVVNRGGVQWYNCTDERYIGYGSCAAVENYIRGTWDSEAGSKSGGSNCSYGSDYYYGSQTTQNTSDPYSGFPYSASSTKTASSYISPITSSSSECGGNGIYLLTDGVPNGTTNERSIALMNRALETHTVSCSGNTLSAGASDTGWRCMGDLSQRLLNQQNKGQRLIKTATVGFGAEYAAIGSTKDLADCSSTNTNYTNTCRLGVMGEGGFYYAGNKQDIIDSIANFAGELSVEIDPVSTGTMSVPVDVLDVVSDTKFVYLPVLDPKPSKTQLWPGNLKKYQILNGRVKGANGETVFTNENSDFRKSTYDLWNRFKTRDDAFPQVGGTYSQIFNNGLTTDVASAAPNRYAFTNDGGSLKRLDVQNSTPSGFGALSSFFTNSMKIAVFNFLGYEVPADFNGPTSIDDNTKLADASGQPIAQNTNYKTLGAVLHSTPRLITYSGRIEDDGTISSRKDYVLYGSMDGALHMVNDNTGKEVMNFLPAALLKRQGQVYVDNQTGLSQVPYGVDSPWSVYVKYKNAANKVEAQSVLASGGLRMGGSTHYALDLSNENSPKLVYAIGSDYADKTDVLGNLTAAAASVLGSSSSLSRMGQSWGEPTQGVVMQGGKRTLVNFLPGGYDACYEDPEFKLVAGALGAEVNLSCSLKTKAQGNAVYMVGLGEIKTNSNNVEEVVSGSNDGKVLWWTSSGASLDASAQFTSQNNMNHSVVSKIRTLDRNYDGLTDHIYFSDLGGQVFRADIRNDENTNTFSVDRVVRLLSVAGVTSGSDAPPRFYEQPLITFTKIGRNIVGVVTVGSGDRSSPLAERNEPNRLYTLIDHDVARVDLFTASTISLNTQDVKPNDAGGTGANILTEVQFSEAGYESLKKAMDSKAAQGWYYKITDFDNESNVDGLKVFNEQDAIAGLLFFNVYNPEQDVALDSCTAGIVGESQRAVMCLPYGTCPKFDDYDEPDSSISGAGIADTWIVKIDGLIGALNTDPSESGSGTGTEFKFECIAGTPGCEGGSGGGGSNTNKGVSDERGLKPLDWLIKR